jgi:hypothetical protein
MTAPAAQCRWCRRQITWNRLMGMWLDAQGQQRCPDNQTPHLPDEPPALVRAG